MHNRRSILFDKQFYYKKNEEKQLSIHSAVKIVDVHSQIPRLPPATLEVLRNQIANNKISFDYLSQADLKVFLSTIFSKIDGMYSIEYTQESSTMFLKSVVAQSVFVLRQCSINSQNSLNSRPCVAVSTLFLRVPSDITTKFFIYRLTPLPIVSNGNKYIYSNLPKIIGINIIDQTVITWDDEADIKQCTFSSIVRCERMPISISLSKSLCLYQLLDDNQSVTNVCKN